MTTSPPAPDLRGLPEELAAHWRLAERAVAASRSAALSVRHAVLAATLLDELPAAVFDAFRGTPAVLGAANIASWRARLRSASPALALLADSCAARPDGPHLRLATVPVPEEAIRTMPIEDFMVSVYNQSTVERVVVATPGGEVTPARDILEAAAEWWRAELARLAGLPVPAVTPTPVAPPRG